MLERWLLYVLRAEPNPLSKRRRVEPFAFRLSASVCIGADSYIRELGRHNVSRFIGRDLFNGGSFVGFDWGNRFSWSFCRRAVVFAVLNEDSRTS